MSASSRTVEYWRSTRIEHSSFINGTWVDGDSGVELTILDPATEGIVTRVSMSSTAQAERAIRSARQAFDDSTWSTTTPIERSRLLHALCDLLESRYDELLECLIDETGSPVTFARGAQVQSALDTLRWFAEAARTGPDGAYERGLPILDLPRPSASLLRSEPAGVVSAIAAYNYPLLLLARKLGGVLASGCTTVVMPSERAPLSAIMVFRALAEVGYPNGVANLVIGSRDVGEVLSTHPDVDVVTFTGSCAVGAQIMAQASTTTKKVLLELGGKSPTIVLPGADIAATIAPTTLRYLANSGQGCGCTTRTFVHRSQFDEYVASVAAFMADVKVGEPRDPLTVMGPLIRESQRTSVEEYVDRAVAAGGSVVAGGGRPDLATGYYMNPVLVAGVSNTSEIAQSELFGPVGIVIPFDTVDEVVALANDSQFGLNAALFGPTPEAMLVARRLRSGTVGINGGGGFRADAPWGGWRQSGNGREGGMDGFREFFETKHIQWPL